MTTNVIAWINNMELAHKFLELARIMGLNVKIPRSINIKCDRNDIIITDDPGVFSSLRRGCRIILIRNNDTLSSLIDIVSVLIGTPSEIVVGVDLGKNKLAYVVIAAGSVLDYGICINCIEDFVEKICRIGSRKVVVGIGYTDSVSRAAEKLYQLLHGCGVEAVIVNEEESNRTTLMGLRGSEQLRKTDLRAAAIVALRSRSWKR